MKAQSDVIFQISCWVIRFNNMDAKLLVSINVQKFMDDCVNVTLVGSQCFWTIFPILNLFNWFECMSSSYSIENNKVFHCTWIRLLVKSTTISPGTNAWYVILYITLYCILYKSKKKIEIFNYKITSCLNYRHL